MEEIKLEKFTDRILSDVNAAMSCLNLYIGHRLDLFKSLQLLGDTDARELADYSHTNERYIREWLECLAAGDYIDHDAETGDGVPYDAYGEDGLEAIGHGNKPMFVNDYVSCWIPAMQGMKGKLDSGANVADIGCEYGWSSISLAKGFPKVNVDAYDSDSASINQANKNALKEGVSKQLAFHELSVEDIPLNGKYDLITAF